MFAKILEEFNWKRVGIVSGVESTFKLLGETLKQKLDSLGFMSNLYAIDQVINGNMISKQSLEEQKQVVTKLKSQTRVIILLLVLFWVSLLA